MIQSLSWYIAHAFCLLEIQSREPISWRRKWGKRGRKEGPDSEGMERGKENKGSW
jgi:hypothetical protein